MPGNDGKENRDLIEPVGRQIDGNDITDRLEKTTAPFRELNFSNAVSSEDSRSDEPSLFETRRRALQNLRRADVGLKIGFGSLALLAVSCMPFVIARAVNNAEKIRPSNPFIIAAISAAVLAGILLLITIPIRKEREKLLLGILSNKNDSEIDNYSNIIRKGNPLQLGSIRDNGKLIVTHLESDAGENKKVSSKEMTAADIEKNLLVNKLTPDKIDAINKDAIDYLVCGMGRIGIDITYDIDHKDCPNYISNQATYVLANTVIHNGFSNIIEEAIIYGGKANAIDILNYQSSQDPLNIGGQLLQKLAEDAIVRLSLSDISCTMNEANANRHSVGREYDLKA